MEITQEFKDLLCNKESLNEFCNKYFMAHSKDKKFISEKDLSEILMEICDERGIDTPSNQELNDWERKRDSNIEEKESSMLFSGISFDGFLSKIKVLFGFLIDKNK